MKIALVKLAGIAGGLGGVSLATVAGAGAFNSSSSPKKEIFLIAKSQGGGTKLFLEEDKNPTALPNKKFVLRVFYGGRQVSGNFLLCSPESNTNEYYLIRWGEGGDARWKYSVNREDRGALQCHTSAVTRMGEKLTNIQIKTLPEGSASGPFKEIDLKSCNNSEVIKQSESSFIKMTCEGSEKDFPSQQKVKIVAQLTTI